METTINLSNIEVLDYQQDAKYIDGGIYQYGRTVTLSLSAFIYPGKSIESTNFRNVDGEVEVHLEEILGMLNSGFVDHIDISGETIHDVKILSYNFPTSPGALENHISLLKVNMTLEFYETFEDAKSTLIDADPEVYKATEFLEQQYAKYIESFRENFNFSINDNYEHQFSHTINFSLRQNSKIDPEFAQNVKEMALRAFDVRNDFAPKVGYLDSRYSEFIRSIQGNGLFTESHNPIDNSYTLTRNVASKSNAYKATDNIAPGEVVEADKNWSSDFNYNIQVDQSGSVSITENGSIQGRTDKTLETDSELATKNQDTYENAVQGLVALNLNDPDEASGAYARCKEALTDFVKTNSNWMPTDQEWADSDDLKKKYVSLGKNLDRVAGSISYTIVFTTNPRMHNDAIFQYTVQGQRGNDNITSVTESGTITPYNESKHATFDQKLLKDLYDKFTPSKDVIDRISSIYESVRVPSSVNPFEHPKNLVSSSISFNAYGVEVSYDFSYSDDPTLRDETYLRKVDKTHDYKMPVIIRSSVVAPNLKETNYDANQTSEGSKSVSLNCIFKRNPQSNEINKDHADYLKTASDAVFSQLKGEVQKEAYISSPQVGKNDLNWYLADLQYSFGSDYNLTFSAGMNFVDKKGVAAEALEY